ncbi:MAG: hypothetical protein J5616_07885 [Bacteroidaceae bacterium]|nr:hypothetical protein [Bacteroidaceae bacterium]
MKKILLLLLPLLSLSCQAQEKPFDINKYKDVILNEYAYPRFAKSSDDTVLKDYALIDIDGDGKSELWVRGDESQDWQGVFSLDGDSLTLLADADVCSEIKVYKNAVGYHSYISPGQVDEAFSVLKNSCIVSSAEMSMKFDIFSDDQEVEYEGYTVNDKEVDEDTYNEFVQKLGDTIEVNPEWHPIE